MMDQYALFSPACLSTALAVWRDLMDVSTGKCLWVGANTKHHGTLFHDAQSDNLPG